MAPALVAAAKTIPAAQLARFGLLRGPLVGFAPACGAFIGGAAVAAMLIPGSRAWITRRATEALRWAQTQGKQMQQKFANSKSEDREDEDLVRSI